jgi:hypothetical protein
VYLGLSESIKAQIHVQYSRVFVLVLRANTCESEYSDIREYSSSKYSCECEYRILYIHKYILVPYLGNMRSQANGGSDGDEVIVPEEVRRIGMCHY